MQFLQSRWMEVINLVCAYVYKASAHARRVPARARGKTTLSIDEWQTSEVNVRCDANVLDYEHVQLCTLETACVTQPTREIFGTRCGNLGTWHSHGGINRWRRYAARRQPSCYGNVRTDEHLRRNWTKDANHCYSFVI